MPDCRKHLKTLRAEWSHCTACDLGERREEMRTRFVFGEGQRRSIMFVAEGPGADEGESGHPLTGESGLFFSDILYLMGLARAEVYLTHVVCCRSCVPRTDGDGQLMLSRRGGIQVPTYLDEPPLPPFMLACRPRLHEEIYLVDPVLIVALGPRATEALTGKACAITKDRGNLIEVVIPGAGPVAMLTEKRRAWIRKAGEPGPVEQRRLRYPLLPTLSPSFVLRKVADKGRSNPVQLFKEDIKKAIDIYERYMIETKGIVIDRQIRSEADLLEEREQEASD